MIWDIGCKKLNNSIFHTVRWEGGTFCGNPPPPFSISALGIQTVFSNSLATLAKIMRDLRVPPLPRKPVCFLQLFHQKARYENSSANPVQFLILCALAKILYIFVGQMVEPPRSSARIFWWRFGIYECQ